MYKGPFATAAPSIDLMPLQLQAQDRHSVSGVRDMDVKHTCNDEEIQDEIYKGACLQNLQAEEGTYRISSPSIGPQT